MGDRANIYLTNDTYGENIDHAHGIYLYTHWSGYEWPEELRKALAFGRGRWSDPSYLTRIIADQMFKDIRDQETGGGISLSIGDNSYPIVCVDLRNQRVGFAKEGQEGTFKLWKNVQSFADYVAEDAADYPNM